METERTPRKVDPTPGSRSAMIIERAPLPIVEVQGSAHIVSHVNSAFCRLLGKSRGELIGKSFAAIVHGGDKCVPILDRVYQTGEAATLAHEEDSDSASWLYAMWPALDANEQPEAVLIQLAKTAHLRQDTVAVNEALLIAGLRQHELTETAEKLNAQLQAEIAERKAAEEKLRGSELETRRARDYAETILRTVPIPFLVLRDDLRVHTASDAFCTTFHVTPAETEGCLVYEIGNGQWNIPRLRELLEEIIPKKNVFNGFEVKHEFATIGKRIMLLNARRMDAEGVPERILLAIEDITERVRAEEGQALLGAIVSSADDGILSKTLDGVVTTWNAGAERLFGHTAEEIIGNPNLHLTPPDLLHEEEHILKHILAGEPIKHFETERMTKDGRRLLVSLTISPIMDATGKVVGASKIVRDITERKKAEENAASQQRLLEALTESVLDGILIVSLEGRMIHFNQRFLKIWNFPSSVLEKRSDEAALQWAAGQTADPAAFLGGVAAAYQTPDKETREELLMADGRVYERCGSPVHLGGAPLCWVWTFRDMTERRAFVENLRFAKEQAESASRAKDDFLAALSHELRTPLTPVLMTAAALETDPALPVEVREQLGMMRRNIELEARLIDDLLDLTRISRGKLSIAPVASDLHLLLEHTAEIVRSDGLGKQVGVVFVLDAVHHHALADPARLQQVFWNLIKNAIKFTPSGSITVTTRNDAEGRIILSVADTGVGISAEALPHIFKAFEQGDVAGQHRYGGLGLGLAISKAIMDAHGGTILVESAGVGRGATFTIALASVDAPSGKGPDTGTGTGTGNATGSGTLRLLIVEDHETTRTVLAKLLTHRGHRVTTASTSREALGAYAAGPFDAVISDLGLPDGSGLDLMREIQRLRPVPAIALSGYGMEDDVRRSKEAGFFAHLVKPVNVDQLRQLIDQIEPQAEAQELP